MNKKKGEQKKKKKLNTKRDEENERGKYKEMGRIYSCYCLLSDAMGTIHENSLNENSLNENRKVGHFHHSNA